MSQNAGKPAQKLSISKMFVWALLGLVMLSLAGFGVGGYGGSVRTVATVGTEEITLEEYARAIQSQSRALAQQTGQSLSFQEMQAYGLDRAILERLIAEAALNHETAQMGLSVGDAEVARQIRQSPAFSGVAGNFDRESYAFALRSANLNEREFERSVRKDTARGLLQGAVLGGVETPEIYPEALTAWRYETRDLTIATVTTDDLSTPYLEPSSAEISAFYEANASDFTRGESRQLLVAWLSPDDLLDQIIVPEETLREIYASRADEYSQPERVMVERLVFLDQASADAAYGDIEAGKVSFADLVEARGLTLEDVDQGEMAKEAFTQQTADLLFAMVEPGISPPLPTTLGPTIYNVYGILEATEVPFETVAPDLSAEFASEQARLTIRDLLPEIDDLLAAGATLSELAQETPMRLETVTFRESDAEGLAGYAAFRAAALAAELGDFPEVLELSDGGLFALELQEITPPSVPPLEDIYDEVSSAWSLVTTRSQLLTRAEEAARSIRAGSGFAAAGLRPEPVAGLERTGFIQGMPQFLIEQAFETSIGTVLVALGEGDSAIVMRLDNVTQADLEAEQMNAIVQGARAQIAQGLSQDIFEAYGQAIQNRSGLTLNQAAINAASHSFRQ